METVPLLEFLVSVIKIISRRILFWENGSALSLLSHSHSHIGAVGGCWWIDGCVSVCVCVCELSESKQRVLGCARVS